MTLPAALYDPAVERTSTPRTREPWAINPLIDPLCRQLETHQIVWAGLGLCCLNDDRRWPHDQPTVWRSVERVA